MITPEMYSAMIGSVIEHGQKYINAARLLCDQIAQEKSSLYERLTQVEQLRTELLVIKSDMDRALLYFEIDAIDISKFKDS